MLPDLPDIVGTTLDGVEPYVVNAADNHAICTTMDVPVDGQGGAHPIFYHMATQSGMKRSIGELCGLCGFNIAHGPMLGSSAVEFREPIMVDVPYRVRGNITALNRKQSSRFGWIDILQYELKLVNEAGVEVLRARYSLVLPRGRGDDEG